MRRRLLTSGKLDASLAFIMGLLFPELATWHKIVPLIEMTVSRLRSSHEDMFAMRRDAEAFNKCDV